MDAKPNYRQYPTYIRADSMEANPLPDGHACALTDLDETGRKSAPLADRYVFDMVVAADGRFDPGLVLLDENEEPIASVQFGEADVRMLAKSFCESALLRTAFQGKDEKLWLDMFLVWLRPSYVAETRKEIALDMVATDALRSGAVLNELRKQARAEVEEEISDRVAELALAASAIDPVDRVSRLKSLAPWLRDFIGRVG